MVWANFFHEYIHSGSISHYLDTIVFLLLLHAYILWIWSRDVNISRIVPYSKKKYSIKKWLEYMVSFTMTFYNVARAKMANLHSGSNPDTYIVSYFRTTQPILLSMTDAYLFMIDWIDLKRSRSKTDHFTPWPVASRYIICDFNSR